MNQNQIQNRNDDKDKPAYENTNGVPFSNGKNLHMEVNLKSIS